MKDPPRIDKDRTILETIEILNKKSLDSVCVCDEEKIIGYIGYREILSKIGTEKSRIVSMGSLYNSGFVNNFPTILSNDTSIRKCAELMLDLKAPSLPVFYGETFLGVIFRRHMLRFIEDSSIPIGSIIRREVPVIHPNNRVIHARRLMLDNNLLAIPVLNDEGKVIGVISESEMVNALIDFHKYVSEKHQRARIRELSISTAMISKIPMVESETSLSDVIRLLSKERAPGVIAIENEKFIGILTYNEILEYIMQSFPEGI
ncbi:MAG: CBS domain-containing protein [Candidatus Methanomethyliaceae archaeon]|nr:CBS domain-containing protein [Candidatus Methanomethyliaceae archaeon]